MSDFFAGLEERHTDSIWLAPDPQAVPSPDERSLAEDDDSLLEAARDTAWRFDLAAVPSSLWDHLIDQNLPTDAQREAAAEAGMPIRFNPRTMPVDALAAALRRAVNPSGDVREFNPPHLESSLWVIDPKAETMSRTIHDLFPDGETNRLWRKIVELSVANPATNRLSAFGNGSSTTRSGERRAD